MFKRLLRRKRAIIERQLVERSGEVARAIEVARAVDAERRRFDRWRQAVGGQTGIRNQRRGDVLAVEVDRGAFEGGAASDANPDEEMPLAERQGTRRGLQPTVIEAGERGGRV